jgi:hypothetical protein
MKEEFSNHVTLKDGLKFADFLFPPTAGFPKDIFNEHVGTAEQGNPPPNPGVRRLPEPGFSPDGIR